MKNEHALGFVNDIKDGLASVNKKIDRILVQNGELYKMLQGFYRFNIKSQIPYMSPKQLCSLQSKGWSLEELSYISGYSLDDVKKKISNYRNV